MLKHKIFRLFSAVFMAACVSFMFSCKTAPIAEVDVDAVDLLDADLPLYISIPVQSNKDFAKAVVMKLSAASDADAEKIVKRLETVYAGTNLLGKTQLAADGAFSSGFVKLAFSPKNGWTPSEYEGVTYYENPSAGKKAVQIAVFTSSVCGLSKDVKPEIKRFKSLALADKNLSDKEPSVPEVEKLDGQILKALSMTQKGDICFYAPVARTFLRKFLGADISFPVKSIYGTLSQLPDSKSFGLKLVLEMNDPKTIKAACAALKIAMFPVPAKIVQSGEMQITVTDITFDWKELLTYIQ